MSRVIRWKGYIKDIVASIDSINAYLAGFDERSFGADAKTVDAVARRFEVVGEASKRIPVNVRERYPEVPWREMARMRDLISHQYERVLYEVLWRTAQDDLPAARSKLLALLESEDTE